MKSIKAGLLDNVVSIYDQTKTTIQGRVFQKTLDGAQVLGPPLNVFVDTVTDTIASSGVTPVLSHLSANGRLFSVGSESAGILNLSLHSINLDTGAQVYNGTIRIAIADIAATGHTLRAITVVDAGTTGWRIYLTTTGSVLINGGLFCVNNVDLADFIAVGPGTLFPAAVGLNQKATYFLQDPAAIGVGQLNIASVGAIVDIPNNKIYVHNGNSTTHQYYVYNTNTSLNVPNTAGVVITAATDLLTHTAHGFLNNDPVFLSSLTGGTGLTNNTVYFVRNITANDYQLSTTTGGAAINITVDGTCSIARAFGTTGDAFLHKTGNLPVLSGTLNGSSSESYAVPAHTVNAGQPCVFFVTNSSLYLGRLSELTSGAVTWANLVSANIQGATNQITAPNLILANWSTELDRAVYLTAVPNILIAKQLINNSIDSVFAGTSNDFFETFPNKLFPLQWGTATAIQIQSGWVAIQTSATGQRGVLLSDLRSDAKYDYSYIVTPVLNTKASVYKFAASTNKLQGSTGTLKTQYRTSGFGSITGGWINIPFSQDITAFASADQVQFKILFNTLGLDECVPAQIQEFYLGVESLFEVSENWEISRELSSNTIPSRVAFRLKQTYVGAIPTLYFRAFDLVDNLLITNNSVTDVVKFEHSVDNGLTWLPYAGVPNTVGTLIRYTFTTPPGIDIRPSLKES